MFAADADPRLVKVPTRARTIIGETTTVTVTQNTSLPTDVPVVPIDDGSWPIKMTMVDGALAPTSPADIDATGIDAEVLGELALKLASTVPSFTSEWAAQQLCLPLSVSE